jgi:hypothetical protein
LENTAMRNLHPAPPHSQAYRVLAGVIGSLLVAGLRPTVSAAQTAPVAPPITVLIRTADGAPVAGVQLVLQPAPADQSGPPTVFPARQAITDRQGRANFPPISPWMWILTLHGTVAGRPIADPADQGAPPWGTNPAGHGFPILADPPLETDGNLPTPNPAAPPAPILVPLFLVDRGDLWLPALDLGSDHTRPLSLPAAIQTQTARPVATPTPLPAAAATITPGAASDLGVGLGLPLAMGLSLVAGLAVYRRRHPHRPASAAYLQHTPRRKETDSHA